MLYKEITDINFEDVEELFEKIEKIHPHMFYNITETEFKKELEKSHENWENLNLYEKYYEILRLNALIGDLHTSISQKIIKNKELPFFVKKYKEGVFISNIEKNSVDESLLFSQILEINNIPVDEIIEMGKHITTTESPKASYSRIARKLDSLTFLKTLGVTEEDEFTMSVLKDGEIKTIKMSPIKTKKEDWFFTSQKNYNFEVTRDYVYIDINSFKVQKDNKLEKIYIETMEALENEKPIIFDVRGNGGGKTSLFMPLCEEIEKNEGKGFCLIDNYSVSASVLTVKTLKNAGFKIVGEPMAQGATFFSEAHELETKGGLVFNVSTTLKNEKYASDGKILSQNMAIDQAPIEPDVFMEESVDDVKNGIDRPLEYCKNEAKFMNKNISFNNL